jgi:integrase
VIGIDDTALELLQRYRMVLLDRFAGETEVRPWKEGKGWLISYDSGHTPKRAKTLTEYLGWLSKRLKIPVHFHSLRHFTATELVHAGVDLPTAAGQLGHSTGVMAESYLHTSDERRDEAARAIGAVVAPALAPQSSDHHGGSDDPLEETEGAAGRAITR